MQWRVVETMGGGGDKEGGGKEGGEKEGRDEEEVAAGLQWVALWTARIVAEEEGE